MSKIFPRFTYAQTSTHFGLRSPFNDSRNTFAAASLLLLTAIPAAAKNEAAAPPAAAPDDLVDIPAVEAMRAFGAIANAAVFVDSLEGPRAFAEIADLVLSSPADAAAALYAVLERIKG